MAYLLCSPLITILALSEARPGAISPLRWCAFTGRVGVEPNVIPPHRPDLNPYVERFHRTLSHECLQVHLPRTREQVTQVTEAFVPHYNDERPNQARWLSQPSAACGLPPVPDTACCARDGRS